MNEVDPENRATPLVKEEFEEKELLNGIRCKGSL